MKKPASATGKGASSLLYRKSPRPSSSRSGESEGRGAEQGTAVGALQTAASGQPLEQGRSATAVRISSNSASAARSARADDNGVGLRLASSRVRWSR